MSVLHFLAQVILPVSASGATPVPPPPIPPISASPTNDDPTRGPHLSKWQAGDILCDDGSSFSGSLVNPPIPTRLAFSQVSSGPATFHFILGPEGRAKSIVGAKTGQRLLRASDLPPAIASSTLPALETPQECTVSFTETILPFEEAELGDIVLLRAFDRDTRIPRKVWRRFVPGDCSEAPPIRALERGYPDYRQVTRAQGKRDWVFLSYDTDADGNTINVRIVGSSDNAGLNAQAVDALDRSRYTQGNRTGCIRYFWGGAGLVGMPERPPMDTYGDEPEACDAEGKWAQEPRLNYPDMFRRRAVEGWAVLRYDVAPWGEIGNIEVLETQPASAFGVLATSMLRSGRHVDQAAGLKGCLTRVMFRLPDRKAEAEAEAPDAD